jgi:hypothetical protein
MADDYLAIYEAMASGNVYDFVTGEPTPDPNFVSPVSAA